MQDQNTFWATIDTLYWSKDSNYLTIKQNLLNQLSPSTALKYQDILIELTTKLFTAVNDFKFQNIELNTLQLNTLILNAIGSGKDFYLECLKHPLTLFTIKDSLDCNNHFGMCIPTQDDYYGESSIDSTTDTTDFDDHYLWY